MTASPAPGYDGHQADRAESARGELAFAIDGMSCAACARRVEKAIGKVEGVRGARVDLVRERAILSLDGPRSRVLLDAAAAVERAGYRLRPIEARPRAASVRTARDRRVLVAWAMTIVAFAAAAIGQPWIELLLATAVVLGVGAPLFRRAIADLRARAAGMDVLVCLGASASLVAAVLGLVAGGAHEHHDHGMGHSDASMAALIVAVVLLGKRLESGAKDRAAAAIEQLVLALPATARVVRHESEAEIPLEELRAGDEVRVAPFARVPVDGEILAGDGEGGAWGFDESVVTGESRPVERGVGAAVLGGATNLGRALRVRARVGAEGSQLGQVIAAVARASADKSPVVRVTDRISSIFAPAVIVVAIATFAGWVAAGTAPIDAMRVAVAVLVVACPCALGLATPVAMTVALGRLASLGILVRDAAALEALPRARTLALDKTGTLTEGRPRLVEIRHVGGEGDVDDAFVLSRAASVEAESHHPLARAIFEEAMRRGLAVPRAEDVEEIAGEGVRGRVEGARVEAVRPREGALASTAGASVVEIRIDGRPRAHLSFEDELRSDAAALVSSIRARGLTPVILSGDSPASVSRVASTLSIGLAHGGLRPDEKVARLAELTRPIAMVGDGLNDAPALAAADVGISFGARAEPTLRAAAIALPRAELGLVLEAHDIACRASRIVRQNLALAFAYNVVALPFAALGAFARIGGPGLAAAAMAASSILVVLNALRLASRSAVWSPA